MKPTSPQHKKKKLAKWNVVKKIQWAFFMKKAELLELSAIVKGNVQGVGYRATTKLYADQLKLTGYVRNLPDGTVEIRAQGEKPQLEKLLSELKREFSRYVDEIICTYRPADRIYSDFRIVR